MRIFLLSVPPAYNRTGCFLFETRPTFTYIDNVYREDYNDWKADVFPQMIVGCAALAWRRGFDLFGVEFWGVCWAGYRGLDYTVDGPMPDGNRSGCLHEIGAEDRAISVFEFQ